MTITLEALKAEHTKFGEMIAAFEKQAASEYRVEGITIALAPGERYAGLVLGENGDADYHLILLPGEAEEITWADAVEWAEEQDGSLPTRREQSLLFANLKGEFQHAYYWSNEQHETNSGWAWYQHFYGGSQGGNDKSAALRARAVRRFIPSVI
ncbi:MAG: DUF1566 domain-containing protein [Paraburkholderia sp.]|uniref:DUF1566 domain-containing protein n=1 Tax=Paraburkholderia sp. TaxID=1926495 RepID=UPI00120A439F|nr:DUF1566 domain-containing protein [Paraburkholderia sp.]TAM07216.1 MAG: DUF1566 domain-containing protein [Paraburkholderia sp.]TAM32646.1 MAG: DUF1566 domain-containing protein [Paraburkholderia sp.]